MEYGFYHSDLGYWQTTGSPSDIVRGAYPEGTTEVPLRPSARHQWGGDEWVEVLPDPAADLAARRASATLPKDDFILAALDAGVLTDQDAEESTGGWPTGWNAFFDGQPARVRIEAKARWATATTVARNAPLVAALGVFAGLSDDDLDALFGVTS